MLRNLYVAKCHLFSFKAQEAQKLFYDFSEKKFLVMDWKIYICDFLYINYLPTLELEELVELKKNTKNVSPTLSVSAVVHFYSFSTGHIKDQKNKRA